MSKMTSTSSTESTPETPRESCTCRLIDRPENDYEAEKLTPANHSFHDPKCKDLKTILALSIGYLGLQGVFTILFGSGNFYLESLGFSDTARSLCWLAGPVAGLFFQPVVGASSDNCSCLWGKRRPFVVYGTFITIWAMMSMAWAEEITAFLSGIPRLQERNHWDKLHELHWDLLIFVYFNVWLVNLAIQPVQMGLRSLVVDLIPGYQQAQANAWMARLTMSGNVIGYCINSIDLVKYFSFLGGSQFKVLCSLVSINMAVCVSITCFWAKEERPKHLDFPMKPFSARKRRIFRLKGLDVLPDATKKVCIAQFFSWLAWFPFLFYIAKYVSELNRGPSYSSKEGLNHDGSFAMLIFASSSLFVSIVLPLMAKPQSAHNGIKTVQSLRRIWLICHIIFFACMTSTFFGDSIAFAYWMVGFMGVSFAGTSWIPFTLISRDIRRNMDDTLQVIDHGEKEDLAATIIGIHNMAIAAPQIVSATGSGLFFFIAGNRKSDAGTGGLERWLLRAAGLSTLAAAWAIRTVPED